ncbi:MAG TPA: hypothetical protein PLZ68_20405 [Ferruginibacter sp.]|nr:hypothetical protein [Ferruginibacter sp.]
MLDDHDIYSDLSFSADEGWAEMKALLNRRMPVSKRSVVFSKAISSCPVLMLSVFFIIAFLPLNEHQYAFHAASGKIMPMAEEEVLVQERSEKNIAVKNLPVNIYTENSIRYMNVPPHTDSLAVNIARRVVPDNVLQLAALNELRNSSPVIKRLPAPDFPIVNATAHKSKVAKRWELSAGMGINMPIGKQEHLQPYPVAAWKFNVSRKFFVAGGVSLFSPAPATVSGVSTLIHVNDTMNNIRMYKEVTELNQFRYADVPLFVGVNLHKNISLQAGIQASYLLSKSVKKSLYPYDFSMNSVDNPSLPLVGAAAGAQEEFDIRVRKFDYRFVTAVKYQYKKMTAGLMYQHGLRSPAAGNSSGSKNQMLSLSLLYNIK